MLLASWEVCIGKTVIGVLKMIHEAAGRGQHFQAHFLVGKFEVVLTKTVFVDHCESLD